MRLNLMKMASLAIVPAVAVWAGALLLDVERPDANPEAKKMNAVLVIRSTACHEPAKSVVTAAYVQQSGGEMKRTAMKVVPLQTPGLYAVVGEAPAGSLIDLAVSNPEYKNYQPRVLIRTDGHGMVWESAQRFFGKTPTGADFKGLLARAD